MTGAERILIGGFDIADQGGGAGFEPGYAPARKSFLEGVVRFCMTINHYQALPVAKQCIR
jgi:hypothetical protein